MSGFNETMILECNRLASEEGKTGNNENNALFSNKIGSGIKVNAGDSVSVYSAFISERGAGGDTIQFNGTILKDLKNVALSINLSHTKITKTNACYQQPINNASNADNQVLYGVPLKEVAETVNTKYNLKDNEVNLKISYYKTRNGDCCVALPRRYMSSIPLSQNTRPTQWKLEDSVANGLPFTGISTNNGGVLSLNTVIVSGSLLLPNRSYFVDSDYVFKKGSEVSTGGEEEAVNSYFKLKSDNSRYKIYVNKDIRKAGFITGTGSDSDMDWFRENNTPLFSPSEAIYIPYEEILTLSCPVGFSSPESIADNLTNQMKETGELEIDHLIENTNIKADTLSNQVKVKTPISIKAESRVYKTFNSFSVNDHNASTYYSFNAPHFGTGDRRFEYNQYLQNYQYIGLKRPDLYDSGIKLIATMPNHTQESLKFCHLDLDINTSMTNVGQNKLNASIQIAHEWKTENLNAWRDFFIAQGNYPELFENRTNNYAGITNINNSRFLHMNLNEKQQTRLGGDNVGANDGFTGEVANLNASSENSVPLFFDYDPSASNTLTNGNDNNPCYGCMYKKLSKNGSYVISFSTNGIGLINPVDIIGNPFYNSSQTQPGVPLEYAYYSGSHSASGHSKGIIVGNYQASGTNILNNASGRICGFDKHFNAYGNAVIGLTDGYLNTDYQFLSHYGVNTIENNSLEQGNAIIDATPYARKIYLGAQEPKWEYSASNQKFNIQQLHTPEYIGNLWNAGIDSASATYNTTENPNAQEKVFKINKRLDNTNFTTDMIPYSQNYASGVSSAYLGVGDSSGVDITLSRKNDMLEPWTIFDSHSGIFIEDFGITSDAWNKSMWDTLGFSYNQFHSSLSSSFNYNTRINEFNKKNMPITTTNADVNAGDTMSFVSNIFGANLFTSQVPLPQLFNGAISGQTPPFTDNRFPSSYPAITQNQSSILIEADELPTKMSRAYYTIRTDLLDSYTYLGSKDSGEALKTISVVNKINGDGDYYFQQDNPLQFTITNPKMITNITTHICDPEGNSAQLNRDSCVMYRIDKKINSTLTPVEQLLQATNKKKD
tara:strand:+ start:1185 stop:4367 length:3183 start_codon:yes stop_codon:yes gene_type:complete